MSIRNFFQKQPSVDGQRVSLTLLQHAGLPALAQTALLTLAPHVHVHLAAAWIFAGVLRSFDDAASEETFTALTAQHIIMKARCFVSHTLHTSFPNILGAGPFFLLTGWPSAQTHRTETLPNPKLHIQINHELITYNLMNECICVHLTS